MWIGRTYRKHKRERYTMHTEFWSQNLKVNGHLDVLEAHGWMMMMMMMMMMIIIIIIIIIWV